jgi:hypothetical protein
MAAKVLTHIESGAANLAALKVLIDAWLAGGYNVVDVQVKDDGTQCIIFYYA